jgi:hypothetical protein
MDFTHPAVPVGELEPQLVLAPAQLIDPRESRPVLVNSGDGK